MQALVSIVIPRQSFPNLLETRLVRPGLPVMLIGQARLTIDRIIESLNRIYNLGDFLRQRLNPLFHIMVASADAQHMLHRRCVKGESPNVLCSRLLLLARLRELRRTPIVNRARQFIRRDLLFWRLAAFWNLIDRLLELTRAESNSRVRKHSAEIRPKISPGRIGATQFVVEVDNDIRRSSPAVVANLKVDAIIPVNGFKARRYIRPRGLLVRSFERVGRPSNRSRCDNSTGNGANCTNPIRFHNPSPFCRFQKTTAVQ